MLNNKAETPLHRVLNSPTVVMKTQADLRNRFSCCQLLLEAGADPRLQDGTGRELFIPSENDQESDLGALLATARHGVELHEVINAKDGKRMLAVLNATGGDQRILNYMIKVSSCLRVDRETRRSTWQSLPVFSPVFKFLFKISTSTRHLSTQTERQQSSWPLVIRTSWTSSEVCVLHLSLE